MPMNLFQNPTINFHSRTSKLRLSGITGSHPISLVGSMLILIFNVNLA